MRRQFENLSRNRRETTVKVLPTDNGIEVMRAKVAKFEEKIASEYRTIIEVSWTMLHAKGMDAKFRADSKYFVFDAKKWR